MSASILNFLRQKVKQPAPWANDELAELYRVVDILSRAGITVETEIGLSDEGDPWFVFCRTDTGEVIAHFARIDGQFVASSVVIDRTFRGRNFRDIIDSLVAHQPLLIPRPVSGSKLYLHPAVVLTAFVATALMHSQNGDWDGLGFAEHEQHEADANAGGHTGATAINKESGASSFWLSRSHPDTSLSKHNAQIEGVSSTIVEQGLTLASIIGIAISVVEIATQYSDAAQAASTGTEPHTAEAPTAPSSASEARADVALASEPRQSDAVVAKATDSEPVRERVAHVQDKSDDLTPHAAPTATDTLVQTAEFMPTGGNKSEKADAPTMLDYAKHHLVFLTAPTNEDIVTAPVSAPSKNVAPASPSYSAPSADGGSHKDSPALVTAPVKVTGDDGQKSTAVLASTVQSDVKTSDHALFQVFVSNVQGDQTWKALDIGPVFAPASVTSRYNDKSDALAGTVKTGSTDTTTKIDTTTKADTAAKTDTSIKVDTAARTDTTTTATGTVESSQSAASHSQSAPTTSPFDVITAFMGDVRDVITAPVTASANLTAALRTYHTAPSGTSSSTSGGTASGSTSDAPIKIVLFNSTAINIGIFQLTPGVLFVEEHQVSWNAGPGTGTLPGSHSVDLSLANGGSMTLLGVLSDNHLLGIA